MGHRANYILRRGGRTQLYFSRWGALSLTQDIFWGPDETSRFIRTLQPVSDTSYQNKCEAGALVDWDVRQLVWFEADYLAPAPVERRLYEQLLQVTWPDWEIRFAPDERLAVKQDRELEGVPSSEPADDWADVEFEYGEVEEDPFDREPDWDDDGDGDELSCLPGLVTRLLDPTRFDPQRMLAGVRRSTREADAGCGCLATAVTLVAIAIAAWVRTAPAITLCALIVLAVLVFAVRIRRRSERLVAMVDQLEDPPTAAGPSLSKKRSVLDQSLRRLGYPTIEQLEQAGRLKLVADARDVPDPLPDRFGPLRALRADEIAGVRFYQLQLNRLRFRELRRGTTLWRACLIKLLARLNPGAGPTIPVPRPERLIPLTYDVLPSHVQCQMQPWMSQAADSHFTDALIYTLPMLGRQEAFSAVLIGAQGTLLASFLYARVRLRVPSDEPDEEESCDEEMFEASLLTVLADGALLVTGTRAAELDPLPGHEIQCCEEADWPTLLATHRGRLAPRPPSDLRPITVAELPGLLLQWNQQEIDHRVARGVYREMCREDIDRYAEEG